MRILSLFRRQPKLHDWKNDPRTPDLRERGFILEERFADWHARNTPVQPMPCESEIEERWRQKVAANVACRRVTRIGLLLRQAE